MVTLFGFVTFAMMAFHVYGAYHNITQSTHAFADEAYDEARTRTMAAMCQAMMAGFWLLLTSRLLGW